MMVPMISVFCETLKTPPSASLLMERNGPGRSPHYPRSVVLSGMSSFRSPAPSRPKVVHLVLSVVLVVCGCERWLLCGFAPKCLKQATLAAARAEGATAALKHHLSPNALLLTG